MEASLRRMVHYDFKDNNLRRSILFDAKADILAYGMAEKTMFELVTALRDGKEWRDIKGLCYIAKEKKENSLEILSFEECMNDKDKFFEAFSAFYKNSCSKDEKIISQKNIDRYLIHNPKQPPLNTQELDEIYDLDYTRELHPFYAKQGKIKAQDTIKFSITTHRGCSGECNFCSIAIHQGKEVVSRSPESILKEAEKITKLPDFKGYITDLGGPTANMYESHCSVNGNAGSCANKRCLFPSACKNLVFGHNKQIDILKKVSELPGVKAVFISPGIRYDMVCSDISNGQNYLNQVVEYNLSGQMKIAPEHCDNKVLALMGKPSANQLPQFVEMFKKSSKKKQFLTYYFIAAYPGCTEKEMRNLDNYIKKNLKLNPEQVQIFTPTPSTNATMMYFCEKDLEGNNIFVEKDRNRKQS